MRPNIASLAASRAMPKAPRFVALEPDGPMDLQRSTVSRKTPRDGKLEISPDSAQKLERIGDLHVVVGTTRGAGRVASMPCTCRGPGDAHVHWFLESEPLKALVPGDTVTVALGTDGAVAVTGG